MNNQKLGFAVLFILFFLGLGNLCISQVMQPLSKDLIQLNPNNVFPVTADIDFLFTDKNKSANKAIFIPSIKSTNNPLFTTEVFSAAKNHYDIQSSWKSNGAIKKGDIVLARFSIRSIYAKQESGEAVLYFFVQHAENFDKSVITEINAGPEWKTMDIAFVATTDMDAGKASICFSYAALAQKVEITNLQLLNFEKKAILAQMPATKFTYQGREANAAWRTEALNRIEAIRTAPIKIKVNDKNGKPITGATVQVKMIQSDFIWGTSVNEALLANELPNSANFKKNLLAFFNTAVIENGFKGATWQGKPQRRDETMRAFNWVEQQGMRQRGHNLVWPAWKFNAKLVKETAQKDTAAFRKLIEEDIRGKILAIKGRVIAWDVINELLHEREFLPYLPKDIPEQWYKLAKELDPNAQLFMNEYGMLNSIASPANIKNYLDTISRLRNSGAPIEAIGIQGHVGRQPRNPAQVISDLDLFKPIGLPVQITEFDINMTDEQLQADYTRDFLIACYSHPAVTGFTIWGFWEDAHWKPDAAMFKKDWTEKPNAAVWREWVAEKWKTNINAITNNQGAIDSRGHLGKYEITVTKNNQSKKIIYTLTKGAKLVEIKL